MEHNISYCIRLIGAVFRNPRHDWVLFSIVTEFFVVEEGQRGTGTREDKGELVRENNSSSAPCQLRGSSLHIVCAATYLVSVIALLRVSYIGNLLFVSFFSVFLSSSSVLCLFLS
ncbi:hypothetical protein E2C01_056935 [Portunus trituberculatus]|uniref:Transmembrane protein n=1 Tax=Portunus trituberculatus TaxID=210409 RepID=A0A5B7GZK1_PORTR|nr:hypothetical protein [Portunus trituberculatus]